MAYTVWSAFDQFRRDVVDLAPEDSDSARTSRDYLVTQLKALAGRDVAFPRVSGDYMPFGSFARKTKIRPLDDIDLLLFLNGRGTEERKAWSEQYVYQVYIKDDSAPLASFGDSYGFVGSTSILNKIRDALSSIPNYRQAAIHRNMQAITLQLKSYTWNFDIVPALPVGSDGTVTHYLIPNGKGQWSRTDPRIDKDNVTKLNGKHNSNSTFAP